MRCYEEQAVIEIPIANIMKPCVADTIRVLDTFAASINHNQGHIFRLFQRMRKKLTPYEARLLFDQGPLSDNKRGVYAERHCFS
jgi:hypothetical protein